MIMEFSKAWKERKYKYPWLTAFFIFLMFLLAYAPISFLQQNNSPIIETFKFYFLNEISLLFWIIFSFILGFLKNQNLSYNKNIAGGTVLRSVLNGSGLFFGLYVFFLIVVEIFDSSNFYIIDNATDSIKTYYLAFTSGFAAVGAFISCLRRGSLYNDFFPTDYTS